jgi:hypothetical protein
MLLTKLGRSPNDRRGLHSTILGRTLKTQVAVLLQRPRTLREEEVPPWHYPCLHLCASEDLQLPSWQTQVPIHGMTLQPKA